MHLVLLSGGSGKRLWPLSNDVRSKQFLQLLEGPDGKKESMVQRVYRQIKEAEKKHPGALSSISVAAGAAQQDQIHTQLGKEVSLICEPERRDTFPAIVLACSYLFSEKKVNREEMVAVLPVDPYVDTDYFERIFEMEKHLKSSDSNILLLGTVPIFPSEKYGYIVPEKSENTKTEVQEVKFFKEKPGIKLAKELLSQGALWNCGVFGFNLGYIQDIVKERYGLSDFSFNAVLDSFSELKKTSFDYEVVERAEKVSVLKYQGTWKDLGTWETFTEEIQEPMTGNVFLADSCRNTHVINEQDLPVVAIGLQDLVVVASRDGLLVANKGETGRLKQVTEGMLGRPNYEVKRWGEYAVLDHIKRENEEILTKKLHIVKGGQISYQYHSFREEVWTIISGNGMLYFEGEKREVGPGDMVRVRPLEKHGILAISDLEIIEVQIGKPLVEDDIVRLEYDWE